ncbi:receptor expression-enhancing protein 5-like [Dermacentor albipictus]|uniref:receptor expression-enhancing protein 5-like n=1 Tax=Dermacentor albipictus TaxID=60249 RepID=UPI0031FCA616
MFSRGSSSKAYADISSSSEESSSTEGNPPAAADAAAAPKPPPPPPPPPTSNKPLALRVICCFHGCLRSRLYADTVLGRSVAELEVVYNVRREFMPYVLLAVLLLSFLIGAFGRHASNLVCVPYPALLSVVSVDSNVRQRYVKWITYWMVFGLVNLGDALCPLVSRVVPQYHLWRTLFLAWCFCPYKWNGCKLIRERLYTARNLRIVRVVAYVFYEGARVVTAR